MFINKIMIKKNIACLFYISTQLLHLDNSPKINNDVIIMYLLSTLECIVKGACRATCDGGTNDLETGKLRTSYCKMPLSKVQVQSSDLHIH